MKKFQSGEPYAGRRADMSVLNVTIDSEAASILRRYGSGRKLGALLARLAFEHQARQEERARIKRALTATLGGEDGQD